MATKKKPLKKLARAEKKVNAKAAMAKAAVKTKAVKLIAAKVQARTAKMVSKAKATLPARKASIEPHHKPAPTKHVTFRILRGAKVNGKVASHTQDFKVPYDNSTTVLQALEWIKGELDGTLTFRRSCRASICGSCGMYINNRSRLACKTKVADLIHGNAAKNIAASADGMIHVGPQKNQPVLKDLVVDIQPFYAKVKAIVPFVQKGKETEAHVNKDSFSQVNMVSNCIMCGACYSDCTAMVENPDFLGPAALAKAYRFVADPREGHKTDRLKALTEKNGMWDCTRCGMCIDACPKGVAPMEAIVKLRSLTMQARVGTANAGARHAMAFKKDMKTWGILNEPFMLLKTLRLGVIGQIGNALNLARKGKIPNPFPFHERAKGLDEVKAIYRELEASPLDVQTKAADSGPGAG
jgi:succinate dehydrogenase / fumarate reductase iron-sulfur subunit